MSIEENRRKAIEFVEKGLDGCDLDIIEKYMAPKGTKHIHLEEVQQTPLMYRQYIAAGHDAIPDLHYEITNVLADGDLVAVFVTLSGTFTNKFGDLEPTGLTKSFAACDLFRFADGKIAEEWIVYDSATRQKLLGTYGTDKAGSE